MTRRLVILGGGTGGTLAANKLRRLFGQDEVAITVVHEIAHHFGIDDDKLHELGWD